MDKTESVDVPHYFSERLLRKLRQMRARPVSVIEAPSGFGKSTAVQDYLDTNVSQDLIYWLAAVDEDSCAAYERFCQVIGRIDVRAGSRLFEIGLPNAFTLGEACDVVRSIECDHEAWLVIDDFQRLYDALPLDFVVALFEHNDNSLHVVIVAQILSRELRAAVESRGILCIDSSDLRFQTNDISNYFALVGIGLTQQEVQRVFRYTDGWAIAVYLQLCEYRETGGFSESAILSLMERLIWDRLSAPQQELYARLSPFEAVTVRQICALLTCTELPDYAREALSCPFVRYEPATRRYEFHSILSSLMMEKRIERGDEFDRECLLAAGDISCEEGRISDAFAFYERANSFEKMLALDLSTLLFTEVKGQPFIVFALAIARNCPSEIKQRHPLSLLQVAWALKAFGEDDAFDTLMEELDVFVGEAGLLRAEWLLLAAYQVFPDLSVGLACVDQAAKQFSGTCSRVILPQAPWCFGGSFQLSEFHAHFGRANQEAEELTSFIEVYSQLTGGHGSGADSLFRAELAYYRGDMAQAEIFGHRAAFSAEENKQTVVQIGAAKVLADIALYRADATGWDQAIGSMERAAIGAGRGSSMMRTILDIARGSLLNDMQEQEFLAAWLKEGDFRSRSLTPQMKNNALYVHVMYLLQQGQLPRFVGTQEAIPVEVVSKTAWATHLFALLMALGHYFLGDEEKAVSYLEQAAEQAFPDGIILSLASASWRLGGLVEDLVEEKYPEFLDDFCQAKKQFGSGWAVVHDALYSGDLAGGLTTREREIALLGADGLRNGEIALKLHVSESTVRAHMRTIFQKLGIDRRAKLAEKLK